METFGRRVAKRDAAEAATSNLLKEFLEHEKEPLLSSVRELNAVFNEEFVSGKPRYSTTNKVDVVKRQIRIRKHVFGRKLPEGCMHSDTKNDGSPIKLTRLTERLKSMFTQEALHPGSSNSIVLFFPVVLLASPFCHPPTQICSFLEDLR